MRTVIITGGTGALGSIVTGRLLSEGWHCLVTYRSESEAEQLIASLQPKEGQLQLHRIDVTDEHSVTDFFQSLGEREIDALIHLVGGVKSFQRVSETSTADWDFLLSLNLRSFFLVAREAMKRFERQRSGRIVAIGSMASIKPSAKQHAYGVAKAGVSALTKILADEGRSFGIRVNCIAPSTIDTPANREWANENEVARWVTPEEIASTLSYLLSPEASGVNGSVIQLFGEQNI